MDSVTVRYQYGNLLRFSVSWCSRNKVTLGEGALRRAGTPFGLAMTAFCGSECKLFHALGNNLRVKTRVQLFNPVILSAYLSGLNLITTF